MTRDELAAAARALVARTCDAQDLPHQVTDPGVLNKIATLLDTPARDNTTAGETTVSTRRVTRAAPASRKSRTG